MRNVIWVYCALLFFTGACKSKQDESLTSSEAALKVDSISSTSEIYTVDIKKSQVFFVSRKRVGDSHPGTIGLSEGKLAFENDILVGGTLVLNMAQVTITDPNLDNGQKIKLTKQLISPDFFDSEKHQTAVFQITAVNPYLTESTIIPTDSTEWKTNAPTHNISGNLTLKDSTRGLTFPIRLSFAKKKCLSDAKFVIDRTNWGIHYMSEASLGDKIINKEVNIGFHIEASK